MIDFFKELFSQYHPEKKYMRGTDTRRLNRKVKHEAKRKGRIDPRTNRPGKRK